MTSTVLVLCLALVLGITLAKPEGYYHQQYNYKTSSQSFRNNELQHKTDDEGYYEKHGDLEGRTRPKVRSNSEHSEYINPKLTDYNTAFQGGAGGETSSYGRLIADNNLGMGGAFHDSRYGQYGATSESLASSDHIAGAYSYQGGHSSTATLQQITNTLEHELNRELESALYRGESIAELESELRRNFSGRLQEALWNRFGSQTIKGGQSYTLTGGRLQPTANYEQSELVKLQRQVEDNLLQRLRSNYDRVTQTQTQSRNYDGYYDRSTTYRPVAVYTPTVRPVDVVYPNHQQMSHVSQQSGYSQVSNVRYTPVPNPEPLNMIAGRVQSIIDTKLNQLLDETRNRYFTDNSRYSTVDFDAVLENLKQEVKNNISRHFDEEISRQYGTQVQRNGQMYSVGPSGQLSPQNNYNVDDFHSYNRQIETHLLDKLNRSFENYRRRWLETSRNQQQETHTYNEYTTIRNIPRQNYEYPAHVGQYEYTTPRHPVITYYGDSRPTSPSIVPLISSGVKGGHYSATSGSAYGGYEVSGGASGNVVELQRQLQDNLSRQLQAALYRSKQSYTSSGYGTVPSYDSSYQQLYDELNRNLTRQLEEFQSGASYGVHGTINQDQLASVRSQLERNLASQLQQGLRQTYSSSSSYSASSSHSSGSAAYRNARGSSNDNYYQIGGGHVMGGDDCVSDDANAYLNHRMKRSYNSYGYRSRPIGLPTTNGHAYGGSNTGYSYRAPSVASQQQIQQETDQELTQQVEVGQEVDDSDLTQQVEDSGYGKLQIGQQQEEVGQEIDDSDLTQQVEDSGYGKLQVGSQHSQNIDLTQQVEDSGYGKLQIGQQQQDVGQEIDNSDLTQQVEDSGYGKLQIGQQQQEVGQEIDNSDLTQQVEDSGYGKLQIGQQTQEIGQQVDDSDLTQQFEVSGHGSLQGGKQEVHYKPQVQHSGYGKLQVENSGLTQQFEVSGHGKLPSGKLESHYSDLTQQIEHSGYSKLQVNQQFEVSGHSPTDDKIVGHYTEFKPQFQHSGYGKLQVGQQVENSGLTQQFEVSGTGKLPGGKLETHYSDLTQQTEDSGFGKLQNGQQREILGQEYDHNDLTQQVEDSGYGKLQVGQQQVQVGQEIDNSDLTQQVEDSGYSKLQVGNQQVQNNDLTQQTEDSGFGKLQTGQEIDDDSDLTQQLETSGNGKLHVGQEVDSGDLTQQVDVSDVTQQVEDNSFGTGSHSKPTNDNVFVSNAHINLNQNSFVDVQSEISRKLEEKLNKKLQMVISEFKYSGANSQQGYEKINDEINDYISREIQNSFQEHNLTKEQRNNLLINLKNILEKNLQQILQQYGYKTQGGVTFHHAHHTSQGQMTTNGQTSHYTYTHHGRPQFFYTKPTDSHNFLQVEINANRPFNNKPDEPQPLETASQIKPVQENADDTQKPTESFVENWPRLQANHGPYEHPYPPHHGPPHPHHDWPRHGGVNYGPPPPRPLFHGEGGPIPDGPYGPVIPPQPPVPSNYRPEQHPIGGYGPRPVHPIDQQVGVSVQGGVSTQEQAESYADALINSLRRNTQQQQSQIFKNPEQIKVVEIVEGDLYQQLKQNVENEVTNGRLQGGFVNFEQVFKHATDDLQKNLTECISGSSEPGLSKYSDLIAGKFNQQQLVDLQKLLEGNLTKKLQQYFSTNFQYSGTGSYGVTNNIRLHYGQQQEVEPQTFETASENQPVQPQQANAIEESVLLPSPQPTNTGYRGGVKGGRRRPQMTQSNQEPAAQYVGPTKFETPNQFTNVEQVEAVEPIGTVETSEGVSETANESETTTESLTWWGKIKHGAKKLKNRVVGN